MSKPWPMVPLKEVLTKADEWIDIKPDEQYQEVTVRLWGKGVVKRREVAGAEITATRRQTVRPQQFILSRIDARNGAFGLVPDTLDGAIVSNDFPVFNHNLSRIIPRFLGWMSKTGWFVDLCRHASEGTTNRVRLKEERFLEAKIPLPPLPEQQRIVAKIEHLAAKIYEARTCRQHAAEETEVLYPLELAASMEPHSTGWKRETVADVITSMDAGWSPQCDNIPAREGNWGVLKTTAVQWCEFWPHQNKALPPSLDPMPQLAVKEGDVLVTRAGPRKRVAVVAAARKDEPQLTISDKLIRLRPDKSKIDYRFLELSLASPFSQEHLVQRKTGLADAQVNISQVILRSTPIAFPPLPEQRRIVAYLDNLQVKVDTLKHMQAETDAELNAMLPSILDKAFKSE